MKLDNHSDGESGACSSFKNGKCIEFDKYCDGCYTNYTNYKNITSKEDLNNAVEYWHSHNTENSLQDYLSISKDDMEYWMKYFDGEFVSYLNNKTN